MKKTLLLLTVLILVTTIMSGCDGMVDTSQDRMRRIRNINELQTRMIVDDWDYIWLYERNTYLSQWYPHVGN
ncbi:MAG TPA: hypothetical protein VM098_08150 [Phycisphaerae bacterium]|nr:hypothetical protein [Phycisphaerae bacterium]